MFTIISRISRLWSVISSL